MDELDSGAGQVKKNDRVFEIRSKIRKRKEDFRNQLMILVDGDVIQFKELLRSSVEIYLNKLSNFAKAYRANKEATKRSRRGKKL